MKYSPSSFLRLLSLATLLPTVQCLHAQVEEGLRYVLPRTALRLSIRAERTSYTPGELAPYAARYLRKDAPQEAETTWRLLDVQLHPTAQPDTSKVFTLTVDKKHSLQQVERTAEGLLLAINPNPTAPLPTLPTAPEVGTVRLSAAPTAPLNPRDYMTEDILQAASRAKQAERTAQEIYDIRDSRNQLSRGEADNMPKDGAQLRMMMAHLDTQEAALTQLFTGVTQRDTLLTTVEYLPVREGSEVVFRFSRHAGVVDADDLGGEPYTLSLQQLPSATPAPPTEGKDKEDKNDIGLRTALPAKVMAVLSSLTGEVTRAELLVPQMGTVEKLSGELFGKKLSTRLLLDPLTGAVVRVEQIELK